MLGPDQLAQRPYAQQDAHRRLEVVSRLVHAFALQAGRGLCATHQSVYKTAMSLMEAVHCLGSVLAIRDGPAVVAIQQFAAADVFSDKVPVSGHQVPARVIAMQMAWFCGLDQLATRLYAHPDANKDRAQGLHSLVRVMQDGPALCATWQSACQTAT